MDNSNVVEFTPSKESALAEIRRQLEQGYALIAGARALLSQDNPRDADSLLNMAEDVLAEHEYINRVSPPEDQGNG